MRIHVRFAAGALGALALLVLACGDGSLNLMLETSLLPQNSDNRGLARVRLPAGQSYDTIEGTVGVVSILEGVGILDDASVPGGPATSRVYLVGTRDSGSDEVSVTDTMHVLDDADGESGSGAPGDIIYADSSPATLRFNTSVSSLAVADWDYVRIWDWDATGGSGAGARANAVLGVSTAPGDMPGEDLFAYDLAGFSLSIRRYATGASYRRAGASAYVDFDLGTVDVLCTHEEANIDFIRVVGMQIEGNSFSGGLVQIFDGGVDVTAARTGGLNGTDAAGLFFGPVVDGAPMEVGGAITIQGLSNSYHVLFVAK